MTADPATASSSSMEGVDLEQLADDIGTPAYVYSAPAIRAAYEAVDRALGFMPHVVAYAVKANGNLAVLSELARLGSGADIVSGGELARALAAGIPPERIVFSGVGKRDDEIDDALAAGVRSIHVESAPELSAIEHVASRRGTPAPISFRVNPNVDAKSHPYISTGLHHTKFGLEPDAALSLLPTALASEHLVLEGVSCHIGSQLSSVEPLEQAVTHLGQLAQRFREAGAPLRCIDAGGGWAVAYGDEDSPLPTAADYGRAIERGLARSGLDPSGLELFTEPGRFIVANAGLLLTRVLYVKERPGQRFIIVDAAMTELLRPALYRAHHHVRKVGTKPTEGNAEPADVVGPVCETGDFLALDRPLPPLERGDLLALESAGAYAATMASTYNARPRAPEVLVDGDSYRVVRRRETVHDLLRDERPQ